MSFYTKGGLIVVTAGGGALVTSGGGLNNGDSVTVTPPGGGLTAFSSKSGSAPTQWDNGQDGAGNINAGYGSYGPSGYTGGNTIYNMQNRAAPFQAGGSSIMLGPHPYSTVFLGSCAALSAAGGAGSNTGYQQWVSNNFTPNTFTYPFFQVRNYYYANDPYTWYVPDADTVAGLTCTLTNGSNQITVTNGASLTGTATNGTTNFLTNRGTAIDTSQGLNAASVIANITGNVITISGGGFTGTTGSYTLCYTSNSLADNNDKTYDLTQGSSIYDGDFGGTGQDLYISFAGTSSIGNASYTHPHANNDTDIVIAYNSSAADSGWIEPDENGHDQYWDAINNPANPANTCNGNAVGPWVQVTHVIRWDSASTAFHKWYENNLLVENYAGPTMWSTFNYSTTVCESIGGYGRNYGPTGTYPGYVSANPNGDGQTTQWRYFAQMYLDRQQSGCARFVISNSASFTMGSGIWFEPLPYTAWATSGATGKINKGNLNSGTAYVYYIDEANGVSPTKCLVNGQPSFTLN